LGAVQKAGTAFETFKGKNIASIANREARQAAPQILQAALPGAVRQAVNSSNGQFFPKAPKVGTGVGSGILGPSSRIGF
jgi:hypothetical protein